MDTPKRIRKYMRETGRTQTYLSRCTGLSPSAISQTLGGKRRLRVDEYSAICKALDVEPGFFLK